MFSSRGNQGNLVVVLSLLLLMLVPVTNSSVTYFVTVTITPMNEFGGVEAVQLTGSIPDEMSEDQFGVLALYFGTPQVILIK